MYNEGDSQERELLSFLTSIKDDYKILEEEITKNSELSILLKEYLDITPERERNLIVKMTRYFIEIKNASLEETFTKEDLKKKLFFKKSDILFYSAKFFKIEKGKYSLNEDIIRKIEGYKDNYLNNREVSTEIYMKKFMKLKDFIYKDGDYNKANEVKRELIEIAEKLHWKYMPLYSEIMLRNRGYIPENDLSNYYDHYHSLEDLYEEIIGKGISWKSIQGDENIDEKMEFRVYTSRWGHDDIYRIERSILGWKVHHISINGLSLKNGAGSLFENLDHDRIFYPKEGVEYALKNLWEVADSGNINFEELQIRIQEIADWISDVERNLRRKQPSWCNYY